MNYLEFTSPPQGTERDAQGNINRMCSYLTDNNVCKQDLSKADSSNFDDPETIGLQQVAKGWVEDYLSGSVQYEDKEPVDVTMDEDDL